MRLCVTLGNVYLLCIFCSPRDSDQFFSAFSSSVAYLVQAGKIDNKADYDFEEE